MTIKTAGAALFAGLVLTACDDALLDYQDPDIISSVNSASGAIALMNGVRERLVTVTTGETPSSHESLIFFGGLLADEWRSGDSFVERNSTDQRAISEANAFLAEQMLYLNRVRTQGSRRQIARRLRRPAIVMAGENEALPRNAARDVGLLECQPRPGSIVPGFSRRHRRDLRDHKLGRRR